MVLWKFCLANKLLLSEAPNHQPNLSNEWVELSLRKTPYVHLFVSEKVSTFINYTLELIEIKVIKVSKEALTISWYFSDGSAEGSSNDISVSQGMDAKIQANNDIISGLKDLPDANNENALLKKIGKKIRLRKKKKREAKQKKTENRAKKALKTIRWIIIKSNYFLFISYILFTWKSYKCNNINESHLTI